MKKLDQLVAHQFGWDTAEAIVGFHSRDQQPSFSLTTKGNVCIIIELNSRRMWSGHQDGRHVFV